MHYDPMAQQPENRLAGENRLLSLARLLEAHGLAPSGDYRRNPLMAGMWPTARPQYDNSAFAFPRSGPTPPFPHPKSWEDDIFVKPSAPGTETLDFDRMGAHEQEIYKEWVRRRIRDMETVPRFR
jgi:hypothetical protein